MADTIHAVLHQDQKDYRVVAVLAVAVVDVVIGTIQGM